MARETILFLLTLLLVLVSCETKIFGRQTIFVNPTATCGFDCNGNQNAPFISLNQLVNRMNNDKSDTYDVYLAPGVYDGLDNMALSISGFNRGVTIRSSHGSSNTIIDCQKNGRWLTVMQSAISIGGITIQNCSHSATGGALLAVNSTLTVSGTSFANNEASKGGAIYAKNSRLVLQASSVKRNSAKQYGGGIYLLDSALSTTGTVIECNLIDLSSSSATTLQTAGDDIFCAGRSNGTSDATSDLSNIGSSCSSSCTLSGFDDDFNTVSLCAKNSTCVKRSTVDPSLNQSSYDSLPDNLERCGDGTCDFSSESCLSCPVDCTSCSFDGLKLVTANCAPGDIACASKSKAIKSAKLSKISAEVSPVSGKASGYFSVPESTSYQFRLLGTDVAARVKINHVEFITAYFQQDFVNTITDVVLLSNLTHTLEIEFFSVVKSQTRSLELQWRETASANPFKTFDVAFYTLNVCGDGILDPSEKPNSAFYCAEDVNNCHTIECAPVPSNNSTCGDGICQEDPDLCFVDCAAKITTVCRAIAKPATIDDSFDFSKDSIGTLIKNQYRFRVPGIEHMTYGVSILTGAESLAPLFYFSFCDEEVTLLQDLYRGRVYTVPNEVTVISSPKCVFDMEFKNYSSSTQMANDIARSSGIDTSANVGVGVFGIKAEVGFEYSQDVSVREAREREQKKSGSVLSVSLDCITSTAELKKVAFHPVFLNDLSQVNSISELLRLFNKFGTHYYKKAALGGKLKQISTVDDTYEKSATEQQMSEQSRLQFSAGVSGLEMFSASFSSSYSLNEESSFDQQSEYQDSTSRSRIITYGGAPGSFGPSSDEAPANFGDWAATVDLLPVPVQYELGRIDEIIPDTWKTKSGTSIKELWLTAYNLFKTNNTFTTTKQVTSKYSFYWHFSDDPFGAYSEATHFNVDCTYNASLKISSPLMDKYAPLGVNTIIRFPRAYEISKTLSPIAAFDFIDRHLPEIRSVNIVPSESTFHPIGSNNRVIVMQYSSRQVFEFLWDGQKWAKDCARRNTILLDVQIQYNKEIDLLQSAGGARFKLEKDLFFDVRLNGYYNSMSFASPAFTIKQLIDINNSSDAGEPIRRIVLTGVEERDLGPLLYSQIRVYGSVLQELTSEQKPIFNLVAMTVIQKKADCSASFFVGSQAVIYSSRSDLVQILLS